MGLDAKQLLELIIEPTLREIGLYSLPASQLVLATGIQESKLQYVKQLGGGPALGIFQCEPATHDDYWKNYIGYHSELRDSLILMTGTPMPESKRLVWDLKYAAAMCRVHYRRIKAPLPAAHDLDAQAAYWKRYYNTIHGAGTAAHFINAVRASSVKHLWT